MSVQHFVPPKVDNRSIGEVGWWRRRELNPVESFRNFSQIFGKTAQTFAIFRYPILGLAKIYPLIPKLFCQELSGNYF